MLAIALDGLSYKVLSVVLSYRTSRPIRSTSADQCHCGLVAAAWSIGADADLVLDRPVATAEALGEGRDYDQ